MLAIFQVNHVELFGVALPKKNALPETNGLHLKIDWDWRRFFGGEGLG